MCCWRFGMGDWWERSAVGTNIAFGKRSSTNMPARYDGRGPFTTVSPEFAGGRSCPGRGKRFDT